MTTEIWPINNNDYKDGIYHFLFSFIGWHVLAYLTNGYISSVIFGEDGLFKIIFFKISFQSNVFLYINLVSPLLPPLPFFFPKCSLVISWVQYSLLFYDHYQLSFSTAPFCLLAIFLISLSFFFLSLIHTCKSLGSAWEKNMWQLSFWAHPST